MKILDNGVAIIEGDQQHGVWCASAGLVHDPYMAASVAKGIKPGDVVVNGGAHWGTLAKPLIDAGATVYAFEPNFESIDCLRHNVPKANIIPVALGSHFSLGSYIRLESAGMGYVTKFTPGHDCVLVLPLDAFQFSDVKLILMDVEGSELSALMGAKDTIARCKPVLIMEVNAYALKRNWDSKELLFEYLDQIGYQWKIIQENCKQNDPQFDIEAIPK